MVKPLAAVVLCLFAGIAFAESCDKVLVQNTESDRSEEARAIASLALVDEQTFDEIKKSSSNKVGASASYKFFSADFDESSSYSEFEQRRRKRLQQHNYSESASSSRDTLRQFLSESQLQVWLACKVAASSSGAVILTATNRAPQLRSASLRVAVRLPPARGSGMLSLRLTGAAIDGRRSLDIPVTGSRTLPFILVFDQGSAEALITSEIEGLADELYVKASEPRFPERFQYARFSFDVCSGHQNGCVGLPGTTTGCHFVEVSTVPSGRYITSVSPSFRKGQIITGASKAFSLTLTPSASAATDPAAARFINACGSSADDQTWRQTVEVEVTHARR